jgi:putative tRNA adenosine deaminase-associated protein
VADYGVLAWHEDGRWDLAALPNCQDFEALVDAMKSRRVNGGTIALISVEEDFFVIGRALGENLQMAISDVTYALENDFAADLIDALDLPFPDEDDDAQPGGDIDLLADLGFGARELETLAADEDLFPDEQIEAIAWRLGFGEQFSELFS